MRRLEARDRDSRNTTHAYVAQYAQAVHTHATDDTGGQIAYLDLHAVFLAEKKPATIEEGLAEKLRTKTFDEFRTTRVYSSTPKQPYVRELNHHF